MEPQVSAFNPVNCGELFVVYRHSYGQNKITSDLSCDSVQSACLRADTIEILIQ